MTHPLIEANKLPDIEFSDFYNDPENIQSKFDEYRETILELKILAETCLNMILILEVDNRFR